VGYFAPHEELSLEQIHEMVALNLLAPMLLTRGLLRSLKETKGNLIFISSFSALESSSFGAAYAATKAGLKHLGDSLFDEVRKSGVKVTTITPDITRTPFYDDLSFAPDADPAAAVTPECVAQSVMQVLTQRPGTVTTHVVLRPERLMLEKRPRRRDS
jgi:short-subunit dehydrogenase